MRALTLGFQSMPNKEDVLRDKTFKEDGIELPRRVFYTLQHDNAAHTRNARIRWRSSFILPKWPTEL